MATVNVKNISASTEDKEIKEFLSFCGKITDIKVTSEGETKSAVVTFEKETAAKTALLLNNTQLGPNSISVTGEGSLDADNGHQADRGDSDEISQEEKPRARILAEYLAHGYLVADTGLKTAISLDEKHGVTQRFLDTLNRLDAKLHATDRAKTADQSYGLTQRATNIWGGLHSYFEKATNTPTGKRVVDFYTQGQRQVTDIHKEAKRLADLKRQEADGSSYRAAGLDKIFGAQKTGEKPAGAAPDNAAAVESDKPPTASSGIPESAQIPK